MGYSRKNPNKRGGGGELRVWNFQGLVKNDAEFPRMTKKKNVEFPGVFLFGLGISNGSNTILWNIQGVSFVLSVISRGKVTKWKIPGGFSKKYILNPVFKKVYPQRPQMLSCVYKYSWYCCHVIFINIINYWIKVNKILYIIKFKEGIPFLDLDSLLVSLCTTRFGCIGIHSMPQVFRIPWMDVIHCLDHSKYYFNITFSLEVCKWIMEIS